MAETKPIPVRFDDTTAARLRALSDRTDVSQSDLIRRAVQFTLDTVEASGSISFLFDRQVATDVQRPPNAQELNNNTSASLALAHALKNFNGVDVKTHSHLPITAEPAESYKAEPDALKAKKKAG